MYNVLIIDDDEVLGKLFAQSAIAEGAKTAIWDKGQGFEADIIKKIKECNIDVVLLDYSLSKEDKNKSRKIAKAIRSYNEFIIIILVSGSELSEYAETLITTRLVDDFKSKLSASNSMKGSDQWFKELMERIRINHAKKKELKRIAQSHESKGLLVKKIQATLRIGPDIEIENALKNTKRGYKEFEASEFYNTWEAVDIILRDIQKRVLKSNMSGNEKSLSKEDVSGAIDYLFKN